MTQKVKRRRRKLQLVRLRKGDDPILKEICHEVKSFDILSNIIKDIEAILKRKHTAVGLAAPQAGYTKRIIATKLEGKITFYVNPEIIEMSPEREEDVEGCLSYPGKQVKVSRAKQIVFKASFLGDPVEARREFVSIGFEARVIQHEIDHLNGKCIVGGA